VEDKSEEINMLEAKAISKYVRMSPFKARQVADVIRGKKVRDALAILTNTNRKSAAVMKKTLLSAVANVNNIPEAGRADTDNWVVRRAFVDEGPTMKRIRPRAMGRAFRIRKRSSHVTIIVAESI